MKIMDKFLSMLAASVVVFAAAVPAQAADDTLMMPIAAGLAQGDAQARLGDSVRFFFAGQATPQVLERLASDKTSLRASSFGKSNERACMRLFVSAMMRLQKRANELGANAVINIVSNFKNVEFASATEFECHMGSVMVGVALKGDFVNVAPR